MLNTDNNRAAGERPAEGEDLDELRRLLLGHEQGALLELRRRMDDRAARTNEVSEVLAEAVALRSGQDEALARNLAPTIEDSLKTAVKKDPQGVVDAIFPVMGPAIRKAISDTLARMVQSLNQLLEHSLSPRSLKWRFEAWRTGRPFAEVVLLHTLLYRVDHLFLIHRESGLLLQHQVAESVSVGDADMVSGMLTAIRDFVRDSFGVDGDQSLDALQIGELRVWVASGPHAVLAAVIRGSPPLELRTDLDQALEQVHLHQADALEAFAGDAAVFESSRPLLEPCLKGAARTPARRKPLLACLFIAALLVPLAWWGVLIVRERQSWQRYVNRLNDEPGILVTESEAGLRRFVVRGLRDPLAADPAHLLGAFAIEPEKVQSHWEPYRAAHPDLVQARAQELLAPPPSVALSIRDGVLTVSGKAPLEWVEQVRVTARTLPGVTGLDEAQLIAVVKPPPDIATQAAQLLDPPDTVALEFADGVLSASGSAPGQWIAQARILARTIPGVRQFDARELADDHAGDQVLARARQVLHPPETISLEFRAGELILSGQATAQWLEQARMLVRTLPEVHSVRDANVQVPDRSADILAQAHAILKPPPTVQLSLSDRKLVASGSAPQQWVSDARVLVNAVAGLSGFDDRNLQVTDRESLRLAEAMRILQPPRSVTLRLEDQVLIASGSAPQRWIERASLLAQVIPDVREFRDHGLQASDLDQILLARARLALNPPDSVRLQLAGDVLTASGSAPHRWIADAQRLTPLIPGLSGFRDRGLIDTDRLRFNALKEAIEPRVIYFRFNSQDIAAGQEAAIGALVAEVRELLGIADVLGKHVQLRVTGHTNAGGQKAKALAGGRADQLVEQLLSRGLPASCLTTANQPGRDADSQRSAPEMNRRATFEVLVDQAADE